MSRVGQRDIGLVISQKTKRNETNPLLSGYSSSSEVSSSSSYLGGDWILTVLLLVAVAAAASVFLGFGFAERPRVKGRSRRGGGDWIRAAAAVAVFWGRAGLCPPLAMFWACGTESRLLSLSSSSSSSSSSVAEASERSGVAKGGSSRSCITAASSRLWSLSEAVGDADTAEGMPLAFRFLGVEAAGLLGRRSCRAVCARSAAEKCY